MNALKSVARTQRVKQEFVRLCPSRDCVPVKRILKIDCNLQNYNQHLNGISFCYIIVTLKYNNFNLMLRSL